MTWVSTGSLGLTPGRYYVHSAARKMMDFQMGTEKPADNGPQEALMPVFFPGVPDAPSASPVEVGPGAEVRGIDIRLKKTRAQNISGKALDAVGNPLKGGILMLYPGDLGVMSMTPSGTAMVKGDKGEFEIRGVTPGSYIVMAMSGSDPGKLNLVARFEVTDQPVRDLAVRIAAGADLPVSVKMNAGEPSNIHVMLQADDNILASMNNVQIGKDGTGVIKKVSPDKYKIEVAGIPPDSYLLRALMGSSDVLEGGLDLRNGVPGPLELTIAGPAARLSGTVKNEKGELVKGATVAVIAKDAKWRTDMNHTGSTDQNGSFEFAGLVPAEYRVYSWTGIEQGAAEDEEFRKPYESFRAEVDLTRDLKAAPLDLKLIPVETRR